MSIFMFKEFRTNEMSKKSVGNNIFTNSLICAPIQDSGKRERNIIVYLLN